MKKRIGISFSKTNFQNYWNWFTSDDLGNDIELVSLSFEKNNVEDIYSCDGFILTGGIDIYSASYQGVSPYENMPEEFQPQRDKFEEKIYRYSQHQHLPLLGICRGLQLVNVIQGGKLIEDLGSENQVHRKIPGQGDRQHDVRIEKDSLLFNLTGLAEGTVNSAHHQAIDPHSLGNNLVANAFCHSGKSIVEGIEFKNKTGKGFMLCVQWHPERMDNKDHNPLSIKIKEKFLAEIRTPAMKNITIINPATEGVIAELKEDGVEDLREKFDLLKKGQPNWAGIPVRERIKYISRFYELLEEHKDVLASTLTAETGKPLQQSYNELSGARSRIKFFIENSEKWLAEEWISPTSDTREKITYEPLGIVGNISAWNYPYLVGVNVFIPALLGGNAVFYKPSEFSLLTGLEIQRLLYLAGIPENCFQVAVGNGRTGDNLLNLPIDGVFFTGSYKTGQFIARKMASRLIQCQLELGGKDPLYVMDDVDDIEKVAAAALEGVIYNNGQSCCAVERIYVHEFIFEKFVESFVAQVKRLVIGNPLDSGTEVGPLTRKEQLHFLLSQVEDAEQKGAVLLTGGKALEGKGYFIEPTVLINVSHSMKVMKEESFGPVIGIQKVKNDEEATRLMMDTDYGLTAAVYSTDFGRAENIMKKMETGTVYWNCCDRVSAGLPWSGRKNSGLGTTLSYQGIRAFVRPKAWHMRGIK